MINWERLLAVLHERKMTQKQVQNEALVSRNWFTSAREGKPLTFPGVCRVADVLDVPVDYLRKKKGRFSEYDNEKELAKFLLRRNLEVEMQLARHIEVKYDLPLAKVDENKPEFKDFRKLAEEIWREGK